MTKGLKFFHRNLGKGSSIVSMYELHSHVNINRNMQVKARGTSLKEKY